MESVSMRSVVLASGSEGNSSFVSIENQKILIDLGKNAKYIREKLNEIGVESSSIDAILISHTHDDHISALKVFLKKDHPKVYVTEKMFYDLEFLSTYDNVVIYDEEITLGDVSITAIHSSHDASDSRNFILKGKNESLVYITDTGYINRKYFKELQNHTYYLMESNHDIEMLMNGPYPKYLQQRILGSLGHLSNKDSSFYMTKLIGEKTKKVVLMHLSRTNNTEEKALEMFHSTMKEYEVDFDNVVCAKQYEITEVCDDKNLVRG